MRNRIIALILAIFLLFAAATPVQAKPSNKDKLKSVEGKIEDAEEELKENKRTKSSLEDQIKEFDNKIDELTNKISASNNKKAKLESKIEKTKKDLKKAEKERKDQQDLLSDRLKTMYMYGDVGYLELLFSSKSFSDLVSRITTIQSLVTYDKKIIANLQSIEDKIEKKKVSLQKNKKTLENLIASLKEENAEVESLQNEKKSALESVKDDIAEQKKQIAQMERDAQALKDQIARENAQSGQVNYHNGSGVLAWPTPGYYSVTSPYGYRYHPISGTYHLHTGTDIGAPSGSRVVAPGNGKVTMASYYGGYGNAVMIDLGTVKGNRMTCLLAHNSRFAVGTGQTVSKGQTVAYVGMTGSATGPHCHIELFVNGERVNPIGYIK